MKVEGRQCNHCNKYTSDVYMEKGWIFFDSYGVHVTNGREGGDSGEANVEVLFSLLQYTLGKDSLDFCSLKCFLNWLFLSDKTNNKRSSLSERERFMKEVLKLSRMRFY